MSKFALPILRFEDDGPIPPRIRWADGTRIDYAGILGSALDPEYQAEEQHKQELRNRDVIVLDDHR